MDKHDAIVTHNETENTTVVELGKSGGFINLVPEEEWLGSECGVEFKWFCGGQRNAFGMTTGEAFTLGLEIMKAAMAYDRKDQT